jgi:hypothetical protein
MSEVKTRRRVIRLPINDWHGPGEQRVSHQPLDKFLSLVARGDRLHYASRGHIALPGGFVQPHSLLWQTVHGCFDQHLPLALSPEVLWYAIVHELASAVKLNPDAWRHLFSGNAQRKVVVQIRDDALIYGDLDNDWAFTVSLFETELGQHVPEPTREALMPRFSTENIESRTALLIAFMDAASPYYSYECFSACGIPSIRMDGSVADWRLLRTQTQRLQALTPEVVDHMQRYFRALLPVIDDLVLAAAGKDDPEFWNSIYKQNNDSGGPYINGWLVAFLAHDYRGGPSEVRPKAKHLFDWAKDKPFSGMTSKMLPPHVSRVPFEWTHVDGEHDMHFLSGVLGVVEDEGFYSARLGFAVSEVGQDD